MGLLNVSKCLGEEFLPNRLLKFRFKFGKKKGKSLFQKEAFPEDLMERVWVEIGENVHDAVQVVHDYESYNLIRHLDKNLTSLHDSSELRESRRRLLIESLATGNFSNFYVNSRNLDEYFSGYFSGSAFQLSALNEERVPEQLQNKNILSSFFLKRAHWDLLMKVTREALVLPDYRNLFSFIMKLSREECLNLSRMKTKDPVLLNDLPSLWEVFFHADNGLAKVKRQRAMTVLNEYCVLEAVVADLLKSSDASGSPEVELRRVFLSERGLMPEENVKKAMKNHGVLQIIAQRGSDLWLKDVNLGKKYIMGMVQVYLDIFQGEMDDWGDKLAESLLFQLPVVAHEKVRSGGGQKWINLQKRVKVIFESKKIWDDRQLHILYDRECDWYAFFVLIYTISSSDKILKNIPADYATRAKVYPTRLCSFLRVSIQLFGEANTRKVTNEQFWDVAYKEMKDGELLHIAVEIGSLIGVKRTALPSMVTWRDGNSNNRMALELAEDKLGKDHEVTKYLRRVVRNLNESGFIGKA